MFPNKVHEKFRDNRNPIYPERRIVTLINENIIHKSKDLNKYVEHYKNINDTVTKCLKQHRKPKKRELKDL